MSRNGKGWALFTVEDYEDSYEFRIFGEDYLKWRHFLVPDSFVYIRIRVNEGYLDKNTGKRREPRLVYNQFQMLHDVMDSQARKLTIKMPLEQLKEDQLADLKKLLGDHKGDKQLHFTLYDREDQVKLNMPICTSLG